MSNGKNFCSSSKNPKDPRLICLENISGVEQGSSARYNRVTDKQEVITLRLGNRTVRNDEIGLLLQNAASINCYSSECKNMVISGDDSVCRRTI